LLPKTKCLTRKKLRARRERPRDSRAAEKRDELASFYVGHGLLPPAFVSCHRYGTAR
jgi:hypothetical protein